MLAKLKLPPILLERRTWMAVVLLLCGLMIASVLIKPIRAHAASLGFDVEASAGLQATKDQIDAFKTSFDQTGVLLGVGAGVVLQTPSTMAEVFGRYSYSNTVGDIFGASVSSSNLVDTGLRVGYRATQQTTLYVEGGYGWQNMDLSQVGLSNKTPQGWMAGLGVQHQIGKTNFLAGLEYEHFFFDKVGLAEGATLAPDSNVVRLSLTYRFGEQKAPDVFDTSKMAPAERGCDPKLSNCHVPLK